MDLHGPRAAKVPQDKEAQQKASIEERVKSIIVEELGVATTEVRSLGGGARSDLWLQIKADVLQRPVQRVAVEESACLGAAILAGVAVGVYRDLEEATTQMVRLGCTFLPDPGLRARYERGYQRYLELYERLEPMFGAEEN